MKKLAFVMILVIAVFLAGCAAEEIGVMSEKEYEKEASEKTTTTKRTTTTTAEPEEEEEEAQRVIEERRFEVDETETGDTVTFKKLKDLSREKDVAEKCDFDYPFECSDYLAKDGIIYLTVKNVGYESKLDEVTLTLKGDICDPADTYIETGQVKEFECYEDVDAGGVVSGSMEIEYYVPTVKSHRSNTGSLVILME